MYLDNSLILIFAKIFEVVDLALSLLLWAQYLSVTDSSAIRSSIWKIHQWIFFLVFQMADPGGINCWGLTVEKKLLSFTAWKVSTFGVILVHIFPHSDWIRRYIPIFLEITDREFKYLRTISKELTRNIINQHGLPKTNDYATNIKNKIKQIKLQHP